MVAPNDNNATPEIDEATRAKVAERLKGAAEKQLEMIVTDLRSGIREVVNIGVLDGGFSPTKTAALNEALNTENGDVVFEVMATHIVDIQLELIRRCIADALSRIRETAREASTEG